MQRTLGRVATVAASSVLLAACGSGSGSLTRSELVTKANAICQTARLAGKAIPQPTSFQDATVAAAYFDKIEPITAKATAELETLKPDSSAASDWNAYISARRQGLVLLQTIRHKADVKDPSGLQDLRNSPATQQRVIDAANKLGATSCAQ